MHQTASFDSAFSVDADFQGWDLLVGVPEGLYTDRRLSKDVPRLVVERLGSPHVAFKDFDADVAEEDTMTAEPRPSVRISVCSPHDCSKTQ